MLVIRRQAATRVFLKDGTSRYIRNGVGTKRPMANERLLPFPNENGEFYDLRCCLRINF